MGFVDFFSFGLHVSAAFIERYVDCIGAFGTQDMNDLESCDDERGV
jgi:hypothetical protein